MKRINAYLGLLACCLFLGGFTMARAETRLIAPRPIVWKDFLGVNAQFLWFEAPGYLQQIDRLKALGLEWVRVDLHWDLLQPADGQSRLAPLDAVVSTLEGRKLKALFCMAGTAPFATSAPPGAPYQDQYPPRDPEDYARFMGELAQRYPSVAAWQIWNEPNLPTYWRPMEDPAGYDGLLRATLRVLKRVAPDRTAVMAGLAYFGQMPSRGGTMLEALGRSGSYNLGAVAAYHPYTLWPEGNEPHTQDFLKTAQFLNRLLREAKVTGIWATEWGWSSYPGPKVEQPIVGEEGQADCLLRRLALMSAMDYDRIFIFTLSDLDARAAPRDRFYGLLDLGGKDKPAYTALANFLAVCGPALRPDKGPAIRHETPDLYSVAWTKPDGTHLWMFWAEHPGPVTLDGIKSAFLHKPLSGHHERVGKGGPHLTIYATTQLQILEWR